jgi:ribonuclease HI
MNNRKKVTIFADGSSLGNPGPGGYGVILRFGEHEKELSGGEVLTTNNRMELLGAIVGLEALKEPCDVTLTSDSQYVTRGINEWLDGWVKKKFAKVKNPDLWERYLVASKDHNVRAQWVKGHDGHEENERCDVLARTQAEIYQQLNH